MPSIFRRVEGRYGKIAVPSIGLEVGTMEYWLLARREDTPSASEAWDLRAVFSYINRYTFEKPGLDRWITIWLGDPKRGGRQYRLQETDGRTVLDGRSLLMEKVTLCPIEPNPASTKSS